MTGHRLTVALTAVAVTAVLTACTPADAAGPDRSSTGTADLDRLTVAAEGSGTGYQRSAFGQRWADVDRNGCGTRDDILARDLTGVRKRGRCVVISGVLLDPYTGQRVQFDKAHAGRVQVDHVVALAEAWRSGADRWTADRRLAFANDPAELLAAAAAVNDSKSDKDAGQWQPPTTAGRCRYARTVVAVKVKYSLTVDRRERAALARDLTGCR